MAAADLFEVAQAEVCEQLEVDIYPAFSKSPQHQSLVLKSQSPSPRAGAE